MRFFFLTIFCIIFSLCSANSGQIEPLAGTLNIVDDLKLAVNKMRKILVEAPESNAQGKILVILIFEKKLNFDNTEKFQAFISLGELEDDIKNISKLFNNR